MNIPHLPADAIGHILGYLPQQVLLKDATRVCKRWKSIITNWRFQVQNFPDFNTKRLPLRSKAQLVADMNTYKNPDHNSPYDIRKASFKRNLSDIPLSSINVRYQQLTIRGLVAANVKTQLTIKEMETLLSKVKSSLTHPCSISLKNMYTHQAIIFFDFCLNNNLSLQKLKLHLKFIPSQFEKDILIRSLKKLADNLQLVLPFHLDCGKEKKGWLTPECIAYLFRKGILFTHLSAKNIPSHEAFPDICAPLLTNPCTLITQSPMTNTFVTSVFTKQLQLTQVDLGEFLPDAAVVSLFESHIASPCKVTFSRRDLTTRVLEVITRKNIIFDKLKIKKDNRFDIPSSEVQNWTALLSQNRIKSLSIDNVLLCPVQFFRCFPTTPITNNRLTKLKIPNIDSLSFGILAKSSLIDGPNFSLSVTTSAGSIHLIHQTDLIKPGLRFSKFNLDSIGSSQSIKPIVAAGSLDQCEHLYLNNSNTDQLESLAELAKRNSNLRTLQYTGDVKLLGKLLSSSKNFPLLNRLIVLLNKDIIDISTELKDRRPSLEISYNYSIRDHLEQSEVA